jgi:hypothetical protein
MNAKRNILLTFMFAASFMNKGIAQEQKKDSLPLAAEQPKEIKTPEQPKETTKKWYDQISLRGYAQVRYNRILETNDSLKCEQCDRSWGTGALFIRRMRLIFSGNVHERVYIYIQPDFASSAGTTFNVAQLRDAYFDLSLDNKKEYRLRFGQSKVPYGFENLQSSQNRLPLDRNDALNSALSNERDLGVFFYWAPEKTRKLYSSLVADGLKGSGDYGVFALGGYNGQTANKPDMNSDLHYVSRLSYPIEIFGQIIEPGIQAYKGTYVVETRSAGIKGPNKDFSFVDERAAASFILYPKPFGIQAEYNIGRGPEFNPQTDSIETKPLKGGYITASYILKANKQLVIPFVRAQYYNGGKKHETDARRYIVTEYEFGIEWQPIKNFELVTMYTISDRVFEDYKLQNNKQKGSLLRLQAQFNF